MRGLECSHIVCAVVFPEGRSLSATSEALFGGALTVLRIVCPMPLPAEWWVSTCAEVDATSVRLGFTDEASLEQTPSHLDQATLESASWLGPVT